MKILYRALACFCLPAMLAIVTPTAVTAQPSENTPAGEIKAFEPLEGAVSAESIDSSKLGQEVVIVGKIVSVAPSTGERIPHRLTLVERAGGNVMIVYWPDMAEKLHAGKGVPKVGTKVSIKGEVTEHKGDLQIRVRDPRQLRIEGYAVAEGSLQPFPQRGEVKRPEETGFPQPGDDGYYTVSQVPTMMPLKGQELSVKGTVADYKAAWSETAPNIIYMRDGGATLEIVYWTTPGETAPDYSKPGTPIFAAGQLQDYQGRLQVKISGLEYISREPLAAEFLARPKMPSEAPKSTSEGWPDKKDMSAAGLPEPVKLAEDAKPSLREIGPEHRGNQVKLEGEVRSLFKDGDRVVVQLADATGFIRVNLPKDTALRLAPGERINVHGTLVFNELRSSTELEVTEDSAIAILP